MLDEVTRAMLRAEVREAVREELRVWLDELRGTPTTPLDFLSVKAAAKLAGVCPATVRTWLQRGQLKRYGTARLPRIHRAEFVQFMAGQEGAPAQARSIAEQAAMLLSRRAK